MTGAVTGAVGGVVGGVGGMVGKAVGQAARTLVGSAVQGAIKRAVACGLTSEYDVVRFVDLTFILAGDFDTNPLAMWTRPILADRTLAPSARMDRLYQRMEEEFASIEKRLTAKT